MLSEVINSSKSNVLSMLIASKIFFSKFLADTRHFLGPLVPLFWISSDVSSGFQSQSGFCRICFIVAANAMYIPLDSPLMLHVPTSWWLVHSRSLPHIPTEDECGGTSVPATRRIQVNR